MTCRCLLDTEVCEAVSPAAASAELAGLHKSCDKQACTAGSERCSKCPGTVSGAHTSGAATAAAGFALVVGCTLPYSACCWTSRIAAAQLSFGQPAASWPAQQVMVEEPWSELRLADGLQARTEQGAAIKIAHGDLQAGQALQRIAVAVSNLRACRLEAQAVAAQREFQILQLTCSKWHHQPSL